MVPFIVLAIQLNGVTDYDNKVHVCLLSLINTLLVNKESLFENHTILKFEYYLCFVSYCYFFSALFFFSMMALYKVFDHLITTTSCRCVADLKVINN